MAARCRATPEYVEYAVRTAGAAVASHAHRNLALESGSSHSGQEQGRGLANDRLRHWGSWAAGQLGDQSVLVVSTCNAVRYPP